MEIINDNEEIKKLFKNSKFQNIKICLIGLDKSGKSSFLERIFSIE